MNAPFPKARTLASVATASLLLLGCEKPTPSPAAANPASAPPAVAETMPARPAKNETLRQIDPATLNLSPGLAEIVKLSRSGLDEAVVLAYIQKSTNAYNPSLEELIYLNDVGLPGTVLAAVINQGNKLRDEAKKAEAAALASQPIKIMVEDSRPAVVQPAPVPPTPQVEQVAAPAPSAQVVVASAPPALPAQVNYFYETLQPYGSWQQVADYGWCWQPTVCAANPRWRPYADRGRWVSSDCGWYWQSDYSWGWAPFHYGRWTQHASCGWVWVPDTQWSAAWVSWRYSDTHCGWAPLPPAACYESGIGFTYHGRRVTHGIDFGLSWGHYTFVSTACFLDRNPQYYYVPPTQVQNIYNQTTVINNYVVGDNNVVINGGIPVQRIAAATHTDIRQVTVRPIENNSPAGRPAGELRPDRLERDGDHLVIYRPHLGSGIPKRPPQVASLPLPGQTAGNDHPVVNHPLPAHETPAQPAPSLTHSMAAAVAVTHESTPPPAMMPTTLPSFNHHPAPSPASVTEVRERNFELANRFASGFATRRSTETRGAPSLQAAPSTIPVTPQTIPASPGFANSQPRPVHASPTITPPPSFGAPSVAAPSPHLSPRQEQVQSPANFPNQFRGSQNTYAPPASAAPAPRPTFTAPASPAPPPPSYTPPAPRPPLTTSGGPQQNSQQGGNGSQQGGNNSGKNNNDRR